MIREYIERGHANAEPSFRSWRKTVETADWSNFAELRTSFASADLVGDQVIFNVGGNKYRLVCAISFEARFVLTKWVGTHAEYDRIDPRNI
jgi:mRNA interferase HigB